MIIKLYKNNEVWKVSKNYVSKQKFGTSKFKAECLVYTDVVFDWCIKNGVHADIKQVYETLLGEDSKSNVNTIHLFIDSKVKIKLNKRWGNG